MNFFSKYKKIILTILITIVLFFAYSFFFGESSQNDELITSTASTGTSRTANDVVGAEIIQALNHIEALKLDRTIFEDPIYRSLIDRSQEIEPEPVGKNNPFDPINTSGVSSRDRTIQIEVEDENEEGQEEGAEVTEDLN